MAVGARRSSGGGSAWQRGEAKGQRAAKRQPCGGMQQVGRRALDRHQLAARALEVGEGVGQAHRVGMARALQHVRRRAPHSTTWPAYITTTRSQT